MVRQAAFILTLLLACNQAPDGPEPNAKAAKVHRVLVKRPSPGYLFDRFTDAWLDTDSHEYLESFLQARSSDPGTSADRLLLSYFYSKQRENLDALEQFQLALALDPGNAEAWLEKTKLESPSLAFSQAQNDLAEASKANPKEDLRIKIAKLQGQLNLRLDQTQEALKAWQQLLKDHPEDDDLWEDLIDVQANEGLYQEAIQTTNTLIARTQDPYQQAIRRLQLGGLYQRAEQREQALETFNKTLEQTGADSWLEKEILAQIERVFRRAEDITGLATHLQKLIAAHPRRLALHLRHADLLVETGTKEEATAAFEEILRRTPGELRFREAYVDMLEELKTLLRRSNNRTSSLNPIRKMPNSSCVSLNSITRQATFQRPRTPSMLTLNDLKRVSTPISVSPVYLNATSCHRKLRPPTTS